ncbi:MAG: hypothetical protein LQ345_005369 [Seirophora villosa]|nr:MAG: hypothetical protein LQ345_005369 [Seirophora villosa]
MAEETTERGFGDITNLPKRAQLESSRIPSGSTSSFPSRFSQSEYCTGMSSGSRVSSSQFSYEEAVVSEDVDFEAGLQSLTIGVEPKMALKRLLSTKSVVSTSSSFAERQRAAVGTDVRFREIGTGSIGKIFEHTGTTWVYKLPIIDDTDKLWNNYLMSQRIEASFNQLGPNAGRIEIPRASWYATSTSSGFWDMNLQRFPFTRQFPSRRRDVLAMERIFPLPKPTREQLINMYCPSEHQADAKSIAANKDCLVRPYLGRKRHSQGSVLRAFSLRNFKLHFDQMLEIGVDMNDLACTMADALAVLHYQTKIDAFDIEFVIGSSPQQGQRIRRPMPLSILLTSDTPMSTYEYVTNEASALDFGKRVTSLWMLDFDACEDISMDSEGILRACKSFADNEPYYPRPHSEDPVAQSLWNTFGQQYINTAQKILDEDKISLPSEFLEGVQRLLYSPGPNDAPSTPVNWGNNRGRRSHRALGQRLEAAFVDVGLEYILVG